MSELTASPPETAVDYRELLRDHEVNSRLYRDRQVFEDELERIFHRVWVYVAHRSEIPEPGDYVTRYIGREAVIVTHGEDGQVSLLRNRCAHRGNTVCDYESGNALVFRCPYHGWTFTNQGECLGVPYNKAYGEEFDRADWSLSKVPRVDEYRGFIFASLAETGPTLEEHLGNARSRIDQFCDLSPTGEVDLRAGVKKDRFAANWKMWLENTVDNYHANFVHQSAAIVQGREGWNVMKAISNDKTAARARDLGNGHAELDFWPQQRLTGRMYTGAASKDEAAHEEYRNALVELHGAERAESLLIDGPPHVVIFPNLFILAQDVRVIRPMAAGRSYQYEYPALLKGAPKAINAERLSRHEAAYGPAGFFMSDDLDIWERTQRAIEEGDDEWIGLARGLHREQQEDGGTRSSHITDEVGQRGIWRKYGELMTDAG